MEGGVLCNREDYYPLPFMMLVGRFCFAFSKRNIKLLLSAKIIDRIKILMKPPLYLLRPIIFRLE